ncbi:MAG TPA: glycosyltransferase family 4 protein [Puia sp.]|jgi:glycosyltransferase involved in cell wall biosynthesis|nr:glycosyltransferase family 4 protein [Puia sp.]
MKKIAIVTTHPIQYNAPLFRLLGGSTRIVCKVFYTWEQSGLGFKYDPDFGRVVEWNIPLLDGYDHTFVRNIAADPGSHHFRGIVNPSLNKEIEDWQPDAILIFGWAYDSHLRCLRHFHNKIPVLFRGDSTLLDEQPGIKRGLRRLFLRWVYSHVDVALYVGCNNKDYFRKHGLRETQLVAAPHAIDNARFANPDKEYREQAKSWRSALNIADTDVVLLFAGKLEEKKDPLFLVRLAEKVPDNRLKFIVVGNGALEGAVQEAARADARFRFLEFQNQQMMPVVYRLGDVFVLPSVGPGETWGLGANEAMASGCAVMLSDKVGGAVDLVREDQNGIVFPPRDVETAAALVRRLLDHREKLGEMKTASRRIVQDFSYERVVLAIENAVTNV